MTLLSDRIPLGDAELSLIEYDENGQIRAVEAEAGDGKVLRLEFAPAEPGDLESWPGDPGAYAPPRLWPPRQRPRVSVSLRYR